MLIEKGEKERFIRCVVDIMFLSCESRKRAHKHIELVIFVVFKQRDRHE